ncbi:MAG: hypothetical protein Q7V15_13190 [Phenylobacterium sp.]|uniref:hypothetical protein n=1 Tax=Phenylobacterium sp. TaxID=1871053 RepID=UPI00271AC825|nr:hypothetical protein [Phenylobacterium sp.]MDO8902295.1 hypothetical protein [Phenylobacterium sp.]MDP2214792.1 hypothetical protein [Phenylobacterium sp.]
MRTVIASLILIAGLSGPALAQDAAEPAPEAPVMPAASAAPDAPPAAPTVAPEPPPTLPTTGDGAAVLSILTRACLPMVQQGKTVEEVARDLGMRRDRRSGSYQMGLGGDRNYTISVLPKGANDNVCNVQINYAVGGEDPIVEALNTWAFLQNPRLRLQRNDFLVGPDNVKRITLAWEHYTEVESTGLVFVQLKNPDDTPLDRRYDQATLLFSERTF